MTVFGKTVDTTRKFTVRKGKKELGVYDSYERAVEVLRKNPGALLTYFVQQ